ncbi:MAG: hypothetical protein KA715_00605 [Xanthomonadaceae bacterium]|nr:hypothetical protein [Xanthomonadaceae bacterium]
MSIKFQNQLRSDCSKLDLSKKDISATQIKALSRCLNSHGDLGSIDESLQNAADSTLAPLAEWMNKELLQKPQRLRELEVVFDELVKRQIIDQELNAMGSLLREQPVTDLFIKYLGPTHKLDFINAKNIQFFSKVAAQLFSSDDFAQLQAPLARITRRQEFDLLFSHQSLWGALFSSVYEASSISEQSPFSELLISAEIISPLLLDLKNEPKLRNHIAVISELITNGKLKTILHTILKAFHTQADAKITLLPTAKLEKLILGSTIETNVYFDSKIVLELKNKLKQIFKVIKKNPSSTFAILNWISHFQGIESPLSEWLVKSSTSKKNYEFGDLSTLGRIEKLVVSADIDTLLFPNPAIKFMDDVSQSWGEVQEDRWPESIKLKFKIKRPPTLEETYLDISKQIDSYNNTLNSGLLKMIIPHSIKEKIITGNILIPVIEENISTIGMSTFRDLFLQLRDSKTSSKDPLRIATHLCHSGFLTGISGATEKLNGDTYYLENMLKALSLLAKEEKTNKLVDWIVKEKDQTRFFHTFDWISGNIEKSVRLGSNISKVLYLVGLSESQTVVSALSEIFSKIPELSDEELDVALELLSHPLLYSVTAI